MCVSVHMYIGVHMCVCAYTCVCPCACVCMYVHTLSIFSFLLPFPPASTYLCPLKLLNVLIRRNQTNTNHQSLVQLLVNFIHSTYKCLWRTYYVPGTVLGPEDKAGLGWGWLKR